MYDKFNFNLPWVSRAEAEKVPSSGLEDGTPISYIYKHKLNYFDGFGKDVIYTFSNNKSIAYSLTSVWQVFSILSSQINKL